MEVCYRIDNSRSSSVLPTQQSTQEMCASIVTSMVTSRREHLFIKEWLRARGFSDQEAGRKLGVNRETVFRWHKNQHKLNPQKILLLADLCGIRPGDLWRMPNGHDSVDAMIEELPDSTQEIAVEMCMDIIRRLSKRRNHS